MITRGKNFLPCGKASQRATRQVSIPVKKNKSPMDKTIITYSDNISQENKFGSFTDWNIFAECYWISDNGIPRFKALTVLFRTAPAVIVKIAVVKVWSIFSCASCF